MDQTQELQIAIDVMRNQRNGLMAQISDMQVQLAIFDARIKELTPIEPIPANTD